MKREATALTTLMLLAAGCIAAPEEVESASVEFDSPLLDSLGAIASDDSVAGEAIVLRTNASPEGGMASFWWEIPEGVIMEDDDETWVEFLAAPVLLEEDQAALERWMIMGFLADEGLLALNTMAFGAPFEVQASGMSGGGEQVSRSLDPFVFGAGGKLRAGERIGFVVAGVATEDVELALVLLPLQEEWDSDDDVPEDTEDFLNALAGTDLVALPARAVGGLHQIGYTFDGMMGLDRYVVTTGPVERWGSTTSAPAVAQRSETVRIAFDSPGYAIAAAGYDSQSSVGEWAATADAHGSVSEASGPLVMPFGASGSLTGIPYVVAIGEGEGPAYTTLTLETASAGFYETLFVVEVDLDTTLQELFGLPALSIEGMTGGGSVAREGDDMRMDVGGARILVPNIF